MEGKGEEGRDENRVGSVPGQEDSGLLSLHVKENQQRDIPHFFLVFLLHLHLSIIQFGKLVSQEVERRDQLDRELHVPAVTWRSSLVFHISSGFTGQHAEQAVGKEGTETDAFARQPTVVSRLQNPLASFRHSGSLMLGVKLQMKRRFLPEPVTSVSTHHRRSHWLLKFGWRLLVISQPGAMYSRC